MYVAMYNPTPHRANVSRRWHPFASESWRTSGPGADKWLRHRNRGSLERPFFTPLLCSMTLKNRLTPVKSSSCASFFSDETPSFVHKRGGNKLKKKKKSSSTAVDCKWSWIDWKWACVASWVPNVLRIQPVQAGMSLAASKPSQRRKSTSP